MHPTSWLVPGWGWAFWEQPGLKAAGFVSSWRCLWLRESILCTRKVSERSLGTTAARWQQGPSCLAHLGASLAAGIAKAGICGSQSFPGTEPKRSWVTAGLAVTSSPSQRWGWHWQRCCSGGTIQPSPDTLAERAGGSCLVLEGCFGVLLQGTPRARGSSWAGGRWGCWPSQLPGERSTASLGICICHGGIVLTHLALVGSVWWGRRSPTAGGRDLVSDPAGAGRHGGHEASKSRKLKSCS